MCGGTQQIETLKWQKDSGTEGSSHTRCEIFICVEIGFFHNMHPICMINVTGQKKRKKKNHCSLGLKNIDGLAKKEDSVSMFTGTSTLLMRVL